MQWFASRLPLFARSDAVYCNFDVVVIVTKGWQINDEQVGQLSQPNRAAACVSSGKNISAKSVHLTSLYPTAQNKSQNAKPFRRAHQLSPMFKWHELNERTRAPLTNTFRESTSRQVVVNLSGSYMWNKTEIKQIKQICFSFISDALTCEIKLK